MLSQFGKLSKTMNYLIWNAFPFTGQYCLVDKTKLAMDLNRFSVEILFVCLQIMVVFLRNGNTTPFSNRSYVTTY
jgi:hypothetical protein